MLRLSMVVKNEEHRYLKRVLESALRYIDDAVIIDDASDDGTAALCREILKGIPHRIIENRVSKFQNEWELRTQQWDETVKDDPDWMLFLDADEIFEESFAEGVKALTEQEEYYLYSFRLYDFWDEAHYREDALWQAHQFYRPFLLRYAKGFPYEFKKSSQHCGRMPSNVFQQPNALSDYRVKHYGWAREDDRLAKYNRYMALDPNGADGSLLQYLSILDKEPALIKWEE
ncbi:MAG: glycosyltransferase family 2 protein [Clostridiales bacterium]|nr:glycosyltransferase family 2 protein [Clostridiales bacterium]